MKKIVIKDDKKFNCIVLVSLIIITVCIIMVGVSYALIDYTAVHSQNVAFSLSSPDLEVETTNDIINISYLEPIPDSQSSTYGTPYTLNISNKNSKSVRLGLKFVEDSVSVNNKINISELRYKIKCGNEVETYGNMSPEISIGSIDGYESKTCTFTIWMGLNGVTQYGEFRRHIELITTTDKNLDLSGANPPQLDGLENMIPVYYTNGNWYKADQKNEDPKFQWYDYNKAMWANVVTVYENTRIRYVEAEPGTLIHENDINAFFVWIPRYKYLIQNVDYNSFNDGYKIVFEKGIETTGTAYCTPGNPRGSTNWQCKDKVGYRAVNITPGTSYMTQPGFTFDGEPVTGLWISKYQASTPLDNQTVGEYGLRIQGYGSYLSDQWKETLKKITFVPGNKLLHGCEGIDVIFRTLEMKGNQYGFSQKSNTTLPGWGQPQFTYTGDIPGDSNNFQVHLATNSEIAALTYLTYSQYGRFSTATYRGLDDEWRHLAHVFSVAIPTNLSMNSINSGSSRYKGVNYEFMENEFTTYGASTTGNIYGVFDTAFEIRGQTFNVDSLNTWRPTLSDGSTMIYGYNVATGMGSWRWHSGVGSTWKLAYWEPMGGSADSYLGKYGTATEEFLNAFSGNDYSGSAGDGYIISHQNNIYSAIVRLDLTAFYTDDDNEVYAGFAAISVKQDVYKGINNGN